MGLKLKTPPACEPVSLKEAKAYLRVDSTNDETSIQNLVKASRQVVEAHIGRCLIEQTWTFDVNAGYASALADDHYIAAHKSKGHGGLELPRSPFIKLSGKPVYFNGTNHQEIKNYRLDTVGPVARIHFGHTFLNSTGTLRIDFNAGYGDLPEDVPPSLKQAILMLTAAAHENRTGSIKDSSPHPIFMNEAVIRMISPYRIMRLG